MSSCLFIRRSFKVEKICFFFSKEPLCKLIFTQSHPAGIACHKDLSMKLLLNIVLAIVLFIVPCFAFAAETVTSPEAPKPAPQLQVSAPVTTAPTVKVAETPKVQSTVKLGYADMAKISSESSLGKASQAQAKARQEKLQVQVQARKKQLDKLKASIEASMANLGPAQKEAKAKEFQKKVDAFQKFAINAEKEFQTLQEGLSKALYEAIEQGAVAYGKANNLALVVVKRELLYLANGVDAQDVSDGIIKLMNEKWIKK